VISVERGYDPADFAVVAFGGAGGLHVAELTERLGAVKAIVPPDPGLLSAYGMLASPGTKEVSRTVLARTDTPGHEAIIAEVLSGLESDARGAMLAEGARADELVAERWIDARYRGQSFELGIPADDWVALFHAAHLDRYGYDRPTAPVEAVTLRVIVTAPAPELHVEKLAAAAGDPHADPTAVVFDGKTLEARRIRREVLRAGHTLRGPLVIEEYSGTTWVPPGWSLLVDRWGCMHVSRAP
jgi:N-methylhydantoinase A